MPKFKTYSQNQPMLLPPLLTDCLPEEHICFMINDIVDNMNLSAIENSYSDKGSPAYDPRMMVKVMFYGHTQGIRSSRKIENRMNEDIACRFLAANQLPDHGTISLFRKEHLTALKELFSQIVLLSDGLGMIDSDDFSVDGTKLKANASTKNLYDQSKIDKLRKKIDDYFDEADAIDEEENKKFGDSVGYNVIPGMSNPQKRKEAIEKMKEKLEKLKQAEQNIKDKQSRAKNKDERESKKNKTSNTTDPDANLIKMKDGSFKMAYNAQFAASNQIITSYDLNGEPSDKNSLISMIKQAEQNTGKKATKIKADAGYFNLENAQFCADNQIDAYIPDDMKSVEERQARDNEIPKYDHRNFQYNKDKDEYTCPEGKILELSSCSHGIKRYVGIECGDCPCLSQCSKSKRRSLSVSFEYQEAVKVMREKLNADVGKATYLERLSEIEPVIGNIKYNQNFDYFLCRGKTMTLIELGLASCAHNLVKIFHWTKRNVKSRENLQWNTLMSLRTAC